MTYAQARLTLINLRHQSPYFRGFMDCAVGVSEIPEPGTDEYGKLVEFIDGMAEALLQKGLEAKTENAKETKT